MRQTKKWSRKRRKHCRCCGKLFYPDPRTKGKQRYCSKDECQTKRQRQNELDWRIKNPDCLEEQRVQSRQWHKEHPDYSKERRAGNPGILEKNRKDTKTRMQKIRGRRMFDKSKSILTQLVGNKRDKCCLTYNKRWLIVRLTKASPLSKPGSFWDNRKRFKCIANRLPSGRFYDLTGVF